MNGERCHLIKAIVFDFGNVICSLDNRIFLRRAAAFTEYPADELENLIYKESDLPRLYETGLIDSAQFFERMVRLCALQMDKEEFIKAYTGIFSPIAPTFDLIRALKSCSCYRLGLLSNTSEWDFERGIRPVEIFDLFDAVSLSYKVKAMKPDPLIFHDMLNQLALEPQQCVFIDDIEENTGAAERLGFHSIRYEGHEKLLHQLKKLAIDIRVRG